MNNAKRLSIALEESQKGTFISLRNYLSQKGELSNVTINGKISYENAKKADIETLKAYKPHALPLGGFSITELDTAAKTLLGALLKPSFNQSQAQKEAYHVLGNGIKQHVETGELLISGLLLTKKVIIKGDYKVVNHRRTTEAQNYLKKLLGLRTAQYRHYKLGNVSEIKLKGITIK